MEKISQFLTDAKVFYLATVDGTQPKVRPLGFQKIIDGKLLFSVGDFKDVYHQLEKNPLCEIVATKPDMSWLRYTGKAVFESDPKYQEIVLSAIPQIKEMYAKLNAKPAVFRLENAKAEIRALTGQVTESINC